MKVRLEIKAIRLYDENERLLVEVKDPLAGKDGGYGPNTNWGAYLRRCESARAGK
jgi:hypothetical protein